MNQEQKLERWAEREIQRNIHNMIISDGNSGYIVFGKYYMEPATTGFTVKTWDRLIHCFANKKTAVSWCIADHVNHLNLANQILNLDKKQQILSNDIQVRSNIGNRSRKEDFAEIVNNKIQPKISQHKLVTGELEKCINSAKYIQIRGFNNETARIHGF
jgi:hypothetical protein